MKNKKLLSQLVEKRLWSWKIADKKFRDEIRGRDNWKCLRCGKNYLDNKQLLHCSHFWSRNHWAVRYEPNNAISLCYPCHYGNEKGWEYDLQGEYRNFMINRLGKDKYDMLERTAHIFIKRIDAIKNYQRRVSL